MENRFRGEEVESEEDKSEDKRESNQRPRRAVIHNVTVDIPTSRNNESIMRSFVLTHLYDVP